MTAYLPHKSVLLNEVIENLLKDIPEEEECFFVDFTYGAGGHSIELLKRKKNCKLLCFDQDIEAFDNAQKQIAELNLTDRVYLFNKNFSSAHEVLSSFDFGNKRLRGIMADLGVSSHHFDSAERGFSFRKEGPLDMRMNMNSDLDARKVINEYSAEDLAEIFFKYGEERFSKRIADQIVQKRLDGTIFTTTKDLEDVIFHCYPKKMRFGKTHPATRVFQALRIYINRELEVLSNVLDTLFEMRDMGFKIAIISFHSLEDRIIKRKFLEFKETDEKSQVITKKPITPSREEIIHNKRSRSAKLRLMTFERCLKQ